jgi:hypothetical protein
MDEVKRLRQVRIRRRNHKQRAQSMLEFALVLPMLLFVTMAIFDFSRVLFTYSDASNRLRDGLRYGAILGYDTSKPQYLDCVGMANLAKPIIFAQGGAATVTVAYTHRTRNASNEVTTSTINCDSTDPGNDVTDPQVESGDLIVMTSTSQVNMITPFFPQVLTVSLVGQRTLVKGISYQKPAVCNDGVCETDKLESGLWCPEDCCNGDGDDDTASCPAATCGNNILEGRECESPECSAVSIPPSGAPECAILADTGQCGGGGPNHFCETTGPDKDNQDTCIDCLSDNNGICISGEAINSWDCRGTCGNLSCDSGEETGNWCLIDAAYCSGSSESCGIDGNGDGEDCDPLETNASCPGDCGSITCGNDICEINRGEEPGHINYCPHDCPCDGDGTCDPNETVINCEEDCQVPNDGICSGTECKSPSNAPGCTGTAEGACECGDGWCSPNEYPGSDAPACPEDCSPCADGACGAWENKYCPLTNGLPVDCSCGNSTCDNGETPILCPGDCAPLTCPAPNGNGACEPEVGEDYLSCPVDCPENGVNIPKKFRWWDKGASCKPLKGQDKNEDRYPGLKWKKVGGASHYEIWGYTPGVSPDPEWVLLSTPTSTKCGEEKIGVAGSCITTQDGINWWKSIPTTGKLLYFRIRACSGTDCGPFSTPVAKVCLSK